MLGAQTKLDLQKELNDVVYERDSLLQRILELESEKFETKDIA